MTQLAKNAPAGPKPKMTLWLNQSQKAESTKIQYQRVIDGLPDDFNIFDPAAVQSHAAGLCKSQRVYFGSLLNTFCKETARAVKSHAKPETIADDTATIYRLEAMLGSIEVEEERGQRAAIWLSLPEVMKILSLPDRTTAKGMRDAALLGIALGAGLRRGEIASLKFAQIVPQGERFCIETFGKGAKWRLVPINPKLAAMLFEWRAIAGDGFVIKEVNKGGRIIDKGISETAIYKIARAYGEMIGKPDLAPHDWRRTYAQFGVDANIAIKQISILLGHESVLVTEKYLNIRLDLKNTISDFIPF